MSYLRLKNVTLGYTFPKEWTRKAFIEKARIYFSGSNLFLLHKGSGDLPVDPEINANPSSNSDGSYGTWGRVCTYHPHFLIRYSSNIVIIAKT